MLLRQSTSTTFTNILPAVQLQKAHFSDFQTIQREYRSFQKDDATICFVIVRTDRKPLRADPTPGPHPTRPSRCGLSTHCTSSRSQHGQATLPASASRQVSNSASCTAPTCPSRSRRLRLARLNLYSPGCPPAFQTSLSSSSRWLRLISRRLRASRASVLPVCTARPPNCRRTATRLRRT